MAPPARFSLWPSPRSGDGRFWAPWPALAAPSSSTAATAFRSRTRAGKSSRACATGSRCCYFRKAPVRTAAPSCPFARRSLTPRSAPGHRHCGRNPLPRGRCGGGPGDLLGRHGFFAPSLSHHVRQRAWPPRSLSIPPAGSPTARPRHRWLGGRCRLARPGRRMSYQWLSLSTELIICALPSLQGPPLSW